MVNEHVASAHPLTEAELEQLIAQLGQAPAILEMGVLIACLGLSWLLVRAWRGRQADASSIWFGQRVVDGVLFPVLALVLSLGVRRLFLEDVPVVVFRVAVPVLMSLALIRLTVKVMRAVFPASHTVGVVERTVSWLAWLAAVAWITGVLPILLQDMEEIHWKIGATNVTLRSLVEGTLSAILVLILSLSLSSAIEAKLLKGAKDNLSLRKIAANAIRALLLVVGFLLAMSTAGIDLTALSVLGGAIGVGLGFGLQKLAANYVSGFVILAERSLRIGDLVRVDNFEGRITDINTRYTVLRASNGRESVVPNELLMTQRVENASLADTQMSITTVVQVAYGTDLEWLLPQLHRAVAEVDRVLQTPAATVFLSNFAPDGLELTVTFWIRDPENGQLAARSAVNMALLRTLNQLGVEIPFPQRVVRQVAAPLEVSSRAT